ncbi:glucose 1-dehydrogenase [Nonomuraea sp. B5E05]|uniref:glucose 1-dehydrogenase n=1 Tax=Nonomuraea sp. B5E05 TaxID=3153569 RepID=UPI0032612E35
MRLLDGRVALITDGTRGMGAAHVRLFLEEGARVVFGDVLDDEGKALAEETGAVYVRHDVTSAQEWERAVSMTTDLYGKLDVLVNNAGILKYRRIHEMSPEDFDRVIDVNLKGSWLGIKSVIDPMKAAGRGAIVNISSIESFIGAEGLSAYSASKFGLRGITKSAARELARFKIRVNSVHPGAINTAMAMDPDMANEVDADTFVKSMVIKRFAKPVEVSHVVAFLASDRASYCTGSEFTVDGGLLTGAGY